MKPRSMRVLELKIPPVVLVIVAAALMSIGSEYAQWLTFELPFESIIAWGFGWVGIITAALGVLEFKRAKTTVNPTKPQSSSSLVRTGIYRYTRNPMYLGFLLVLVGWATSTSNIIAFVIPPAFVFYMNRFQIDPEERALTSIFGDEFRAFCTEVRRWI